MRGDKEMRQIALRVSIALAAGMFSIVPVTYGAPVGGQVVKGGASIAYTNAASGNGGKDTNITSTTKNNVIDWHDFSVAEGEKVQFDGGTKGSAANNYMNIVTGANTSEINGAINGGNEVYIINPNGVIFGENASVNVGSLYASTRGVTDAMKNAIDANGNTMESVINTKSAGVATDIVNMGTITANKVVMEGQNIRFYSDDVTVPSTGNVIMRANTANDGYVHIGNSDGSSPGTNYKAVPITEDIIYPDTSNGIAGNLTSLTGDNYYKLIDGSNWHTTIAVDASGNYMLKNDIVAGEDKHDDGTGHQVANFAPITDTFTGKLDGNFHKISGMTGQYGLFKKTAGATIENLGVVNSTISGGTISYTSNGSDVSVVVAGAIVGQAFSSVEDDNEKNTVLNNVYNEGSTIINNTRYSGGLVGHASGLTIKNSYNTGDVKNSSGAYKGGGLVGYIEGIAATSGGVVTGKTNTIDNSYNTGNAQYGVFESFYDAKATINNVYAKSKGGNLSSGNVGTFSNVFGYGSNYAGVNTLGNVEGNKKLKYSWDETAVNSYVEGTVDYYITGTGGTIRSFKLPDFDISNTGGVTVNSETGEVTRPTWRIYEGRSTPMLTSQFKGIKNTVYDYAYFKTDGTVDNAAAKYNNGSNGGEDIPAYTGVDAETNLPNGLIYNAEYLKLVSNVKDDEGNVTTTAATATTEGKLEDTSLAFTTKGISTIDSDHIFYDADGRKDATFKKNTGSQSEGTQNTLALLYSDQSGYDLVGNNIAIAPRKVSVDISDIGSVTIVKEYDGNSKASGTAVDKLFSGDTSTVTGILAVDKYSETNKDGAHVDFGGTATFMKDGVASNLVGDYRYDTDTYTYSETATNTPKAYVYLDGSITLTDSTNNYVLAGGDELKGWAQGAITQKTIQIGLAGSDYSRVYNNHSIAKGNIEGNIKIDGTSVENSAVGVSDFTVTAEDATITDNTATFSFKNDAGETVTEQISFTADTTAYYVEDDGITIAYAKDEEGNAILDGNNNKIERADIGDHKVRFSGLKLSGGTAGNYRLVNADGETIYSAGKLITATTNTDGSITISAGTAAVNPEGGDLYATGTVSPRPISSTGFVWYKPDETNTNNLLPQVATREYNGYSSYEAPKNKTVSNAEAATADTGMLAGDSLTFTVQSAEFVDSATGELVNNKRVADATKNVADAAGVLYTVTITGDAAKNYTLDGGSEGIDTTKTYTVIGEGHLDARTINLIVNPNAAADKDYDGNEYVLGATETNPTYLKDANLANVNGTGFLVYEDTTSENAADHHFVDATIDPNAQIKVIGKYQVTGNEGEAKNVNYDENQHMAIDKNIVYEATVMEGDSESSNYKFKIGSINNGATVVTLPDEEKPAQANFSGTDAKGTINQRTIDKIVFANAEKTFDDDYEVKNKVNDGDEVMFKTNDRITITGIQAYDANDNLVNALVDNSVDAVFNTTNGQITDGATGTNASIVGIYGEDNEEGEWEANKHAGDKVVHYTLKDSAWKNHNYKLSDDAVTVGTGKIKKLTISPDDIKLERNNTDITKVYNGDNDVATTADNVGNVNRSVTDYLTERQAYVSKDGKELSIAVNVDGAAYETRHHKNDSGSTTLAVNYTVSLVNSTDYTIQDGDDLVEQITRNVDANDKPITGTITARPITVTTADIVNSNVSKVYDATDNVVVPTVDDEGYPIAEPLVKGINAQILNVDKTGENAVSNATTGTYNNKNVNTNDTANLDENGLKPVTYDLKLNNDNYGDYKFVDGDGTAITDSNNDENHYPDIAGKGTITKRPLTISTTANPTKDYGTYDDGLTGDSDTLAASVKKSTMPGASAISFGSTENNAVVASDVFDADQLTGLYGNGSTDADFKMNGEVKRDDDKNVINKDVQYSGVLAALGDNAGNYEVANTFYGTGKIEPAVISGNLTFTIGTVAKEYDGVNDNSVRYTGTVNGVDYYRANSTTAQKNWLTAPTVNGSALAYELDKAVYDGTSVGTHTATFTVGFSSNNYNFDNITINGKNPTVSADGIYWADISTNTATITPRKVYLAINDTTPISKTYDTTPDLDAADAAAMKVESTSNVYVPDTGDFLSGDDVGVNWSTITAEYADKDAGLGKNVYYTVALTGTEKDNYVLYRKSDSTEIKTNNKLTGTGDIEKADIVSLDIVPMNRTYNGSTAVNGLTAADITITGVNGETITLSNDALALISGNYGTGDTEEAFKPNGNVRWDNGNVADRALLYTGISDALALMNSSDSTNAITKNYNSLKDTLYFSEAQAKGKIRPISITNAAITSWIPVTREYNADMDTDTVYDYSTGAVGDEINAKDVAQWTFSYVNGENQTVDVTESVSLSYDAAVTYDNPNVAGNHVLNYVISNLSSDLLSDAEGNQNYQLADGVLSSIATNQQSVNNNNISKRQLNASIHNPTGNRKIYDGTPDADKSNFLVADDDREFLEKVGLWDKVVITANYNNKHSSVDPDDDDTNTKTITYTLALNDNSGNYEIATPTATAQGDIERRKVYVDGTNATAKPKNYDGGTALPAGTDYDAMGFDLRAADSTTGRVDGDGDLVLDATNVSGTYVSPNVKRAADGSVIAQDITFTGFSLKDTNSANDNSIDDYVVIDANGSGVINPLPVTVGIVAAPKKTYDGTRDIIAADDNVVVTSGLLDDETANILIDTGTYDNANAGTNKGYNYNITLDNGNYTLTQGANEPDIVVSGNGLKGKITASDGTIDKRLLTPSIISTMTKEYDGTTDGTENAAVNVGLANVVNGDNVGITVRATYDNPNAGISAGSSELQKHKVTYTLNLSNSNYELAADTVTGTGTISRKGLNIVATPASVNTGEAMPKFTGTVEGLLPSDLGLASGFTFKPLSTTSTSVAGSYPVYGWYSNRTSGNFGLNYTFSQDESNATAFTVNASTTIRDNPDTKIAPRGDIYRQMSQDMNSGFGDNGAAALEYVDKSGKVIARENIGSGEIHGSGIESGVNAAEPGQDGKSLATIGIAGGDIVNLDGADAASTANIEVDSDGSIVNLEVFSIAGEKQSVNGSSVAENVSTDSANNPAMEIQNAGSASNAAIQIVDASGNVLEEKKEDKAEKQKKEGEIAIESSNNQADEIELKVEREGVNVA